MQVSAWNNGDKNSSGAGYGLKISKADRDIYFEREWETVLLQLPNIDEIVECNIDKDSFWNSSCHELINKKIGQWLISISCSSWPDNDPPKFEMVSGGHNKFNVKMNLMLIKDDIEFLKAYRVVLQRGLISLDGMSPDPDYNPLELPSTAPEAEHAAIIADSINFDGSLFRDDIPCPMETWHEWWSSEIRKLKKRIKIIHRIITEIEKYVAEPVWKIENGQVFFCGKELKFPAGQIQEVMEKFINSMGKTVTYKQLGDITTLHKIRHYKSDISKILEKEKIPFEIVTITNEGYKFQEKLGS